MWFRVPNGCINGTRGDVNSDPPPKKNTSTSLLGDKLQLEGLKRKIIDVSEYPISHPGLLLVCIALDCLGINNFCD